MERKEGADRAQLLNNALDKGNSDTVKPEKNGMQPKSSQVSAAVNSGSLLSSEKKEKLWAKEEIEMLRKGMQKYPKGTSRRWEVISEYIGTGRSVEEILKATKTVLLQKPDSANAFGSFLEKRKPAPSISSPLTSRLESEGISVNGVEEKPSAASPSSGNGGNGGGKQDHVSNGVSSVTEDTWSVIQERALIQALKTFPKEASQRWERVSTSVPGKTVNQCKKKFTLMRESFRSNKGGD
ncbi:hypothetical protein KSP39_PZI017726 [Platanthera zijinensis]|uniref:Myb-like domain-containing protein n=1 Tax=Platanthera zijinensis TaxID=2320716 RepID=A0AAP0B4S7_9ASPA